MKSYVVSQEREVKIWAESPSKAIETSVADVKFGPLGPDARETRIEAREEF